MNRYLVLLPVLVAFLVGAAPATAWTWPVGGPVLQQFQLGDDPYAADQHRGIDVGGASGVPGARAGRGYRHVRRHGAGRRPDGHDRDAGRLRRDRAAPRLHGSSPWSLRARGRGGRHPRTERRHRARGAVRPSRGSACRRPARLPRPAGLAAAEGGEPGGGARKRGARPGADRVACKRSRRSA